MVQIRKICSEDTPQVKALICEILEKEFPDQSRAYSAHDLDDPLHYYGGDKDVFLVAEKDAQIVGTVAIKEDAPDTALLRRVFLNKKFRGQGYGEKLLQKAIDFCFSHGYQNITFRGTDEMRAAFQLCLKKGFQETNTALLQDIRLHVLTKRLKPSAAAKPEQTTAG